MYGYNQEPKYTFIFDNDKVGDSSSRFYLYKLNIRPDEYHIIKCYESAKSIEYSGVQI